MATGFVNEAVKGKKKKKRTEEKPPTQEYEKTCGVRFPYADV